MGRKTSTGPPPLKLIVSFQSTSTVEGSRYSASTTACQLRKVEYSAPVPIGNSGGVTIRVPPTAFAEISLWTLAVPSSNFSTKSMRAEGGLKVIEAACEKLRKRHEDHMKVYGAHNEERLTGKHETCNIHEFRWGVSDRGASIRIPMQTANTGKGYLEDRRPAANMDPYQVCSILIETICGG